MSMMLNIKAQFKFPKKLKLDTRQALTIIAGECLRMMHEAVGNGVDADGAPYRSYGKYYHKWKKEMGRNPETPGDWLRFSGAMLASHGLVELTDNKFVIGFMGTENAIRAWSNNRVRRFVGLSFEKRAEAIAVGRKFLLKWAKGPGKRERTRLRKQRMGLAPKRAKRRRKRAKG